MKKIDTCVISGVVVHGKALGRTVGMPTCNLAIPEGTRLPKEGVYATRVKWKDRVYRGVTNIGKRPTVDTDACITVETYILDFDQDIYGEQITLEICAFIRDVQKFASLQAVQEQVQKDILIARQCVNV